MHDEKKASSPSYQKEWLHSDRFPKTAAYDLDWMLANEMGPNPLWLLEELLHEMTLSPGARVLDLGCGRALTSIFLAREHDVQVFANDLWVSADDNWSRVTEAGLQNRICPIRAEAHALPYAVDYFDAVVSIDSYQYFGTDDLYLGYITRFLKPGGAMGLVMPAILQEFEEPPPHFKERQASGAVFWDPSECLCLHTLDYWKRLFERTGLVDLELAETVKDGWKLWRDWERIRNGGGFTGFPSDVEVLEKDAGRYIGFVKLVLKKRPREKAEFDHPLNIRL
jgi:cyclopropane fatty-acyl-phospholipid synthase-like methyltransferase